MKLLMHTCCGPCSIGCVETLRGEGIDPTAYFFNPNIHPFAEYKARRDTLSSYAQSISLPLIIEENYGLRSFINAVYPDFDDRCGRCYASRMDRTAEYAAANGFEAFTTTLLISPYQDHELIAKTCQDAAEKHGVAFLYRDFRANFREGQAKARALGLYMQKYCGCVFSEEERYLRKNR